MNSCFILSAAALAAVTVTASAENQLSETAPDASATCCEARQSAAVADGASSTEPEGERPVLHDLTSVAALKDRFNKDRGRVRMIFLLSPTCPMCVRGSKWAEEHIMEAHENADFAAYVVWLPVLPPDTRSEWDPELLDDARAVHFWDEDRIAGDWFQTEMPDCPALGPVAWDAIYLFDEDAVWRDDGLDAPALCATPIYRETERIGQAIKRLMEKSPSS